MLNVLLRAEGGGDWMGGPEVSGGDVALLRLPIAEFGDGSSAASRAATGGCPGRTGESWSFHNRFVGDHVLYGGGDYGGDRPATLFAAPVRGGRGRRPRRSAMRSAGSRCSAGTGWSSAAAATRASASPPSSCAGGARLGDVFTLPAAQEGETRSHAFFFRPDNEDGSSGILGLPIAKPVEEAYQRFFGSAAAMLFLRRDDRRFRRGRRARRAAARASPTTIARRPAPTGTAMPGRSSSATGSSPCSATSWSRAGSTGGRIRETGRTNFAPGARRARRDFSEPRAPRCSALVARLKRGSGARQPAEQQIGGVAADRGAVLEAVARAAADQHDIVPARVQVDQEIAVRAVLILADPRLG